ncbi:MAG: TetR/AcrR family transcriptional regulator [Brevefilum sp.]
MTNTVRGVETRQLILDASMDLFAQNGYDATSMSEICQAAQISKGAFYHHFPSKQALFLALMATWLNDVEGTLRSAGDSAQTVPQAFEEMAGLTGHVFEALEGGFPILLEFWRQASRQPEIWKEAVAPYHRCLDLFAGMVHQGIADGDFHPEINPDTSARILMAVAMGLLLQASFDPKGADWQSVTRSGIRMILDGLRS